jgi:hypothetical protein
MKDHVGMVSRVRLLSGEPGRLLPPVLELDWCRRAMPVADDGKVRPDIDSPQLNHRSVPRGGMVTSADGDVHRQQAIVVAVRPGLPAG